MGITMAQALLAKSFFSAQGLLPSETFLEELFTFPAPDFQNLAGGALTRSMSTGKFVGAAVTASNFGWDIGSEKSKILMMFHAQRIRSNNIDIFFADTLPAAGEVPDGSYLFDTAVGQYALYKRSGGAFALVSSVLAAIDNGTPTLDSGLALYYDAVTHRLVAFIRTSPEVWFPILDVTDASFTTMRYAGIRFVGAQTWFNNTPLAIYTEP